MHIISDENYQALQRFTKSTKENAVDLESDAPYTEENVYQLGAHHAFSDVLGVIESSDGKKTPVDGRLLTGVVVLTAAVVLYKPAKKVALKLKKKFQR